MSTIVLSNHEGCQRDRSIRRKEFRFWLVLLCLAPIAKTSFGQPAQGAPSIDSILAGMVHARAKNEASLRGYTVTRDYKLFDSLERRKTKSQVTADMTFVPPGFKSYAIQRINGAGLGGTLVRRILANEVEIAKDQVSSDFSPENYEFRFVREEYVDGRRCYVLELLPRRKAKNLLRGNIWVNADTYLVQRLAGEPSKLPSWWLKRVHISLVYGDVAGMWLQTGLEASATVRLLGPHTIVSSDVSYKVGALASTNR